MQVVVTKNVTAIQWIPTFCFTDFKIHFAKETEWNGKKLVKVKKKKKV